MTNINQYDYNDSRTIGHLLEPEEINILKQSAISVDKIYKKNIKIDFFENIEVGINSEITIIENLNIKNIFGKETEIISIPGTSFVINIDKSIHNVYSDSIAQLEYLNYLSSYDSEIKNDLANIKPFLIKKAIDEQDVQPFEYCDHALRYNINNKPEHKFGPTVKFIELLYKIKFDKIYKLWSCNLHFEKIIFITDYDYILNNKIYLENNIEIPYYIDDLINQKEYTFGKNKNELIEKRIGLHILKNKIQNNILKEDFLSPKKIYVSRSEYNKNYFFKYFEIGRDLYRHGMQQKSDLFFNLEPFENDLMFDEGMRAIVGPMSGWSKKEQEVKSINALYDTRFYHDEFSLQALLKNKFGYEPIQLEKFSIAEQLNLFYNAEKIISFSSSAMVNLIACKDSIDFYEISSWKNSPEKFRIFGFKKISKENNFSSVYNNYKLLCYHKDKKYFLNNNNVFSFMWTDPSSNEIIALFEELQKNEKN